MGLAIQVTSPTFAEEVLEQSYEKPVLVDFYAQWCGPCQMLTPLLDKLVQEYDFVLAKVDIDHNPELANAYQVEGVPDVRVVNQGDVQPGFVGMLPEADIRALLSQLGLQSAVEVALAQLASAQGSGNLEQVRSLVVELRSQFPQEPAISFQAAQGFLANNDLEAATDLLQAIDPYDPTYGERAVALQRLIQLKQAVQSAQSSPSETPYPLACQAAAQGDYESALAQFLAAVEQGEEREAARKAMVTLFTLLGNDHPLTMNYRKRLMQALY